MPVAPSGTLASAPDIGAMGFLADDCGAESNISWRICGVALSTYPFVVAKIYPRSLM